MRLHQIRNATFVLDLGPHVILVDPMFSPAGAMPSFKLFGDGQRNPTTELPEGAQEAFDRAGAVLITHEHPDHLDPPALEWIKERGLTVGAAGVDAPSLESKGLSVQLVNNDFLGIPAEVVPATHGRGPLGFMMGPVSGFYLAHPDEPSVYITGDTVLTDTVRQAIARLRPDVVIAPAGAADFGIGGPVIFGPDELLEIARIAPGDVVFNHMEALDHCTITRAGLRSRLDDAGIGSRAQIPRDGDVLSFERKPDAPAQVAPGQVDDRTPGLQKWLTARLTGT
jgi:L-ascorbate metabolism protein UlaG (beta-lactamase superfamily)